ncbi:gas vesicle accessory protein GvpU [Cupriavidus necator]
MAEVTQQDISPDDELQPQVDWHLQTLIRLANNMGAEMGITLMVNGTIITGTLISGKAYFEEFAANFAAGWANQDDEARNELREMMAQPAKEYGPDNADIPISFIHLRNATVRTPTGSMPNGGILWRGRLTEVSGFFLGILS